jgi:AraC-like DNA-binding protein
MLHCHPFYELVVIDQGEVKYTKTDSLTEVKNKTVIFNKIYDIHNPFVQQAHLYKRYRIKFTKELLSEYIKPCGELEAVLDSSYIKTLDESDFNEINMLSRSVFDLCSKDELDKARISLHLSVLLLKCFDAKAISSELEESYVKRVALYIENNLCLNLTIERLANSFFVSKTKLIYDFKRAYNMGIAQYVTTARIKAAQKLLTKGYSVTATAEKCGFSSTSYFIKVFSEMMGTTPLKYQTFYSSKSPFLLT